MSWYYPYGFRWFQDGGSALPGILVTPREMAQYMGGRGDIGSSSGVPTRSQVEGQIKQGEVAKEQLKKKLERVGYKGAHARAMVNKGRSKLPENVKEKLENQEASDYRVQHHPDYDPSRPVEDQQDLNYDNSFRTTVLRGANMFTDSGDPVVDFMAGAATAGGRGAANFFLDAPKRYVQPGFLQGAANLGLDIMDVATGVGEGAVANELGNRLVRRGLPAASRAMEQEFLKSAGRQFANPLRQQGFDYEPDLSNLQGATNAANKSIFNTNIVREEIKDAALDYYNLTKDPRYLDRVRALDQEFETDGALERWLAAFHKQGEATKGDKLPFGFQIKEAADVTPLFGQSAIRDDIVKKLKADRDNLLISNDEYKKAVEKYYAPDERDLSIWPKNIELYGETIPGTVSHELKHHWTSGLFDPAVAPYSEWLSSPLEPYKPTGLTDILTDLKKYKYYTLPTEFDAHIMTEMRDEMVKRGFLKDHFAPLSQWKFEKFFAEMDKEDLFDNPALERLYVYFHPKTGLIKDKSKFVDVFNKALPVAAGAGVGLGAMSAGKDKKKWGGEQRWFQNGGDVLPGILMTPREMAKYMSGRGDIGSSSGVPTRSQVEGQIKQGEVAKEQLKKKLERVGYKGAHARAMVNKGRSKLPENVKEKLENQEASDYRVQHHPDYDPSRPVEDQQDLNYDNSFRTTVLRGANMFTDSGNPVTDFVAGAATGAGRSFANIVLDAPKQYVEPIVKEGWRGVPEAVGNLGIDVMTLVGEGAVGNRIANRLASRGLPEASAAMENELLSFRTPGTPRAGRVSRAREVADEASDIDDGLYEYTNIEADDSYLRPKSQPGTNLRRNPLPGRKVNKRLPKYITDNLFDTDNATKEEIKKAALDYLNLTEDPRYLERVRALDKELGMNGEMERRLKLFQQQGKATMNDDLPFGFKINELMGALGRSHIREDILDKLDDDLIAGRISDLEYNQGRRRYFAPEERTLELAPNAIMGDIERSIASTTSHELKHHWTSGGLDPDAAPYANMLSSIAEPFPEARLSKLYKDFPEEWLAKAKKRHQYLTKAPELDAYIMTNFRNMLVKKGYLKDHFDELTEEGLDKFVNYMKQNELLKNEGHSHDPLPDWVDYYFNPEQGVVKDKKKFVNVFNKALPVATGVGVGLGAMQGQEEQEGQQRWGGEISLASFKKGGRVPGMPLIGVRGLI